MVAVRVGLEHRKTRTVTVLKKNGIVKGEPKRSHETAVSDNIKEQVTVIYKRLKVKDKDKVNISKY